jgi:hypothetical protein
MNIVVKVSVVLQLSAIVSADPQVFKIANVLKGSEFVVRISRARNLANCRAASRFASFVDRISSIA